MLTSEGIFPALMGIYENATSFNRLLNFIGLYMYICICLLKII